MNDFSISTSGSLELTWEVMCHGRGSPSGGRVQLAAGRLDAPDVVLTGRPDAVVGLVAGALRPAEATAHGVSVTGDVRRLSRLRPRHRRS